jgi:hypothetical protein
MPDVVLPARPEPPPCLPGGVHARIERWRDEGSLGGVGVAGPPPGEGADVLHEVAPERAVAEHGRNEKACGAQSGQRRSEHPTPQPHDDGRHQRDERDGYAVLADEGEQHEQARGDQEAEERAPAQPPRRPARWDRRGVDHQREPDEQEPDERVLRVRVEK